MTKLRGKQVLETIKHKRAISIQKIIVSLIENMIIHNESKR